MGVKDWLGRTETSGRLVRVAKLEKRVRTLEEDIVELRRHELRLAELTDLVQELLMPMALRDEDTVRSAIEKFNKSV